MHIDPVSLADLEVFREPGGRGGLMSLFAPTQTAAGRSALHRRLRAPATEVAEIVRTQDAVRFFAETWMLPLLSPGLVERVERHLGSNIDLGARRSLRRDVGHAMWLPLRDRDLCRELTDGVHACVELLSASASLARSLAAADPPAEVRESVERLRAIPDELVGVRRPASLFGAIRTDRLLRVDQIERMRGLVATLGELDALRAMGATTRARGWVMPELVEGDRFFLEGEGLHHPFLEAPTGNPVEIAGGEPVVFLTGPNMAGKTTYMRAIGLATLLAQVGMGVPAARLRLTPVEVVLTGLNPSDNLRAGLSFFFAEVLRVKEAAEHLAEGRRCLVLFDEVFKGTNVRDALDASLAVISGFAKSRRSGCVFSSHLVELAGPLSELGRIRFLHFEGELDAGRARYTYRLRPGVSDQRFGLQLLEEAKVPELLAQIGT